MLKFLSDILLVIDADELSVVVQLLTRLSPCPVLVSRNFLPTCWTSAAETGCIHGRVSPVCPD